MEDFPVNRIYYFDYSALIVELVILAFILIRRMYRGRTNRYYFFLTLIALCTTVTDIFRSVPIPALQPVDWEPEFRAFVTYIFHILRIITPMLLVAMVGNMTGVWARMKRSKAFMTAFHLPAVIYLVVLFSNIVNRRVFFYMKDGDTEIGYGRGPLMTVLYVIAFYYLVFTILVIFSCRRRLTREKHLALLSFYGIVGVGLVIEALKPEYLTQMFSMSMALLVLAFFVFRPDQTYDADTGARSYETFIEDVNNNVYSGIPTNVVFGRLSDSEAIRSMVGTATYRKIIRQIFSTIESHIKEGRSLHEYTVEPYYLRNGLYAGIVSGPYDREVLRQRMNELVTKAWKGFYVDGMLLQMDFHMCGVEVPKDFPDAERLIAFADTYDYYLTENSFKYYDELSMERNFVIRAQIDRIITKGLTGNNFRMYYQPIWSVKEKRFRSAEALIRLHDDELGFIPPDVFIKAAEKNGTIIKIGDFVINDVMRFIHDNKPETMGVDFIEVNLSILQCLQGDLAERINDAFKKYDIKAGQVNFEITETATEYAYDAVISTMKEISNMGSGFSLDDYGSGYSNLQRLMSFPYKIIKIDKSLVDQITVPKKRKMIENTVNFIRTTGTKVVVEGVETEEQAQIFIDMGVDYIQGYYYARPMPEEEYLEFLRKNNI